MKGYITFPSFLFQCCVGGLRHPAERGMLSTRLPPTLTPEHHPALAPSLGHQLLQPPIGSQPGSVLSEETLIDRGFVEEWTFQF